MPASLQPSLLVEDHPPSIDLQLKVAANGRSLWGSLTVHGHDGIARRLSIPHTLIGAGVLSLPDDMRDFFTAWLYSNVTESVRVLKRGIERWQDDGE